MYWGCVLPVVIGWCDVIRVESMMSIGLRVNESLLGINMTQSFVLAFPSSPPTSELIQDLHPPPSPLSTFLPTISMSSQANSFPFEVSIPFMVMFEFRGRGDEGKAKMRD